MAPPIMPRPGLMDDLKRRVELLETTGGAVLTEHLLWGQPFDGTADVDGPMTVDGDVNANDFVLEGAGGDPGAPEVGGPIAVKDEGTLLTAEASILNFVGPGVAATNVGGVVTVSVPHTWAALIGKPTTIAGFGITDFNSLGDARWLRLIGGTLTGPLIVEDDVTGDDFILGSGTGGTPGDPGTPVAIKDEGSTLTPEVTSMNFVGPGVVASAVGSVVTVTVAHTWASLVSKPTTIGGFGITDFNSLGDARWIRQTGGTLDGPLSLGVSGYFRGHATQGYRFNNAADTLNLSILRNDGRWEHYGSWSTFKSILFAADGTEANYRWQFMLSGDDFVLASRTAGNALTINYTTLLTTFRGSVIAQNGAGQFGAAFAVRGATNGNAFEFGHSNTGGYGSSLGHETSSGTAFLAFFGEAGSSPNTYRTRGNRALILQGLVGSRFSFRTVASANADNQSPSELAYIDINGNFSAVGTITSTLGTGYGFMWGGQGGGRNLWGWYADSAGTYLRDSTNSNRISLGIGNAGAVSLMGVGTVDIGTDTTSGQVRGLNNAWRIGGNAPIALANSAGGYPMVGYNFLPNGAGGWNYAAGDYAQSIWFYVDTMKFMLAASGGTGGGITWNERFRISNSRIDSYQNHYAPDFILS